MEFEILAINPGSTSTKISIYSGESMVFTETIDHNPNELDVFENVADQYGYRKNIIKELLGKKEYKMENLSAIVARGGILPPVKSGAYLVNDIMVDRLKNRPLVEHASNLGAIIAKSMADELDLNAYIYDSVSVDEMDRLARLSGMVDIERSSTFHALNSRAMAFKLAGKIGKAYEDGNFIVAHLGGGISISAHKQGKVVDILADDEGPFSPERAGKVPCKKLIDLCYSGKFTKSEMHKKLRGKGGVYSYMGITDMRDLEKQLDNEEARLLFESMAYQVAKGICELSASLFGKIDRVVLTGGIAYSKEFTSLIKERVEFLAPVEIMPGESEMESLAFGALRVLQDKEKARKYEEA